jgi:PST family polysaccharide transporter
LAFSGFGVWSLVAIYIASAIVNVVAVDDYTVATRFLLTMARVKGPYKVYSKLVGFFRIQLLDEKWRQPTRRSIRRISSFGNLRGSYQFLLLPVAQVSRVITNVMFPVFSAIQKDVERVNDVYLKSISIISLVTFPLTLGLLVVSQSFVLAFFGDKWAEMIPILPGVLPSWTYSIYWHDRRLDLSITGPD